MRIAHARSNEIGQLVGGKPGDQTKNEVCVQDYFDYSWTLVFRPKDPKLAENLAKTMETIAKNDHIGYWAGTKERYGLYLEAKRLNWQFDKITKNVDTDCSQMVTTALIANGVNITPYMYTASQEGVLDASGKFDKMPFQGSNYLKRGDILLTTVKGHTVVVLDDAKKDPGPSKIPQWYSEIFGINRVDVLSKPKAGSARISTWPVLGVGNLVDICDESGDYYYIRIAGKYFGYIPKKYTLRKTVDNSIVRYATTMLNVRANAGAEFESVGYLKEGERLFICDVKPAKNGVNWYYIKYKDGWGFCSTKYTRMNPK